MIFVSTTTPFLRILIHEGEKAGEYVQFLAGKLELDEDEPGFPEVHAEALRNPGISILVNSTTCELCGEVFTGRAAKAQFGSHIKRIHPDVWDAEQALAHAKSIDRTVKQRAGFACDVCSPVQTFGEADDLAAHVRDLHTAAPELDDDGNDVAGGRRPGEAAIPAAQPTS